MDLDRKRIVDMVEGHSALDLRTWCSSQDPAWLRAVRVVATDLAESYRAGTSPHLDHAIRVADPFHVVRIANSGVDKVRRRVQNETLGHRGRQDDPLYRIRKLLLAGYERLDDRGMTAYCSGCVTANALRRAKEVLVLGHSLNDVELARAGASRVNYANNASGVLHGPPEPT